MVAQDRSTTQLLSPCMQAKCNTPRSRVLEKLMATQPNKKSGPRNNLGKYSEASGSGAPGSKSGQYTYTCDLWQKKFHRETLFSGHFGTSSYNIQSYTPHTEINYEINLCLFMGLKIFLFCATYTSDTSSCHIYLKYPFKVMILPVPVQLD